MEIILCMKKIVVVEHTHLCFKWSNEHEVSHCFKEVIRVRREFKCFGGGQWCAGLDCCAYEVAVEAPVGTTVGYVRQA